MCAIFSFVAAEDGATNAVAISAPVAIAASTFFKVVPLLLPITDSTFGSVNRTRNVATSPRTTL